ncbi:MAG: ATP-grasp domain-containing protein, partial [Solirubrobacteraceae bacterium]
RVIVLTALGGTARYRHRTMEWRSGPTLESPTLLPYLDQLMNETPFDCVLPLTEAGMFRLWDASPAWAAQIFPSTAAWQRRLLRDKYTLSGLLAARSIDVPRHQRLCPDADPAALARELGLPLVVKGATGAGGARVAIVETVAELARAMQRARSMGGAWGVQELVDGPTVLFGGVFHDGRALRIFAGEKLEQYPRRTGPAIRMRSLADPALLELGTRILGALRWTGFASVDFIRRGDGRYTFLEVNPRLWGSATAARSAGVDLFTPFAAMLAGELPAPELAFAADQDARIFPRYMLSPSCWRPRGVLRFVRDLLGAEGRAWRHPGLLCHLASNLMPMRRRRRVMPNG